MQCTLHSQNKKVESEKKLVYLSKDLTWLWTFWTYTVKFHSNKFTGYFSIHADFPQFMLTALGINDICLNSDVQIPWWNTQDKIGTVCVHMTYHLSINKHILVHLIFVFKCSEVCLWFKKYGLNGIMSLHGSDYWKTSGLFNFHVNLSALEACWGLKLVCKCTSEMRLTWK